MKNKIESKVIMYQKGQVLLIVVLLMVVVLTIGLSIATRSVTTLRTSTEEDNSQRAFSAAEAGIERALRSTGTGTIIANQQLGNNAEIRQVRIGSLVGPQILLNNGNPVQKDQSADIWLSTYPTYAGQWSGNLTIYWGSSFDSCQSDPALNSMAAIEVVILSGSTANPVSRHAVFDGCGGTRVSLNKFSTPLTGRTILGKSFRFRSTTLSITSGLIARVVPLYADTVIGVEGNVILPAQGTLIDSTGVSGETHRKIRVFRSYPQLFTEFFPYILLNP